MEVYNPGGDHVKPSFKDLVEKDPESVFEAAILYTRMGLCVTPLNGKQPILLDWTNKKLAEEELPRHFGNDRNIGLVLGGGAGLVNVDFDNPVATATDALNTIRAKALYDGPEVSVFRRVAGHGDDIYIDLGNERWEMVRVSQDGWSVVQECPVRFIRKRGMASLPYPESGGSVDDLKPFLNLGAEDAFRLLVAWAAFSLTPWGPYVILVLQGEQGSAKSTTVRVIRALVDPAVEPLRALPRDERDLAIAANNAWVLAIDNLSGVPDRISDALCRLATGGGFATRELYTDDEEMVFSAKRPIILHGIDDITTRGDLQERSLLLSLPSIPKHKRQEEKTFWANFDAARPRLFGALLDTVSGALQNVGDVHLDEKPRMADFAIWGTAAERALGWEPESFIRAYTGNREEANEALLGQ